MISHLVDSDWVIDYLKGRAAAVTLLRPLIEQQSLALSVIVYAEVLEGVLGASDLPEKAMAFAALVAGVPVLGIDQDTAGVFAGLRRALRTSGEPIPDHDTWIAATAIRHNLMLVSRDRHFTRIPDLKLHTPA